MNFGAHLHRVTAAFYVPNSFFIEMYFFKPSSYIQTFEFELQSINFFVFTHITVKTHEILYLLAINNFNVYLYCKQTHLLEQRSHQKNVYLQYKKKNAIEYRIN